MTTPKKGERIKMKKVATAVIVAKLLVQKTCFSTLTFKV